MHSELPSTTRMNGRLVGIMAVISGLVVANSYYAQPLVGAIADSLDASMMRVGLVVTASQVGYAIGLAFLVPLGDMIQRRKLMTWMLAVTCASLVVMAVAPSWQVLACAAMVAGVGSVVGQVLVPFAASLAAEEERGRVIGNVMTGLLLGILLSRVVAGLIAYVAGWRAVFVVAAILMVVAALLVRTLPVVPPSATSSYRALLASVFELIREEPVLRWRIGYGTLTYASFGVFWTSIGFLLSGPGYGWSDARIGLFTLVGVAGALAARLAGTLADRGYAQRQTGWFVALTALSFVLVALGEHNVFLLAAGVALLDLGIQGTHISNQSLFYPLRPDARSRLNTAYMTTYFTAGSIGSALSVLAYTQAGWTGVCVLGAGFPTIGFGLWLAEQRKHRNGSPR
ncbi:MULTISPECIES: MFS transporter [unclassified Rhodococcus (in: high G+C Gram-positive bacteria)]|uniref:MFS transporter n=1 Tax=unclassified Rhodococcus (in: high G+C Gram-positive bacteria) TaxID=192944 RepID=UPI00211A0327|nr:MFS transporter [Rhodococcus sp. 1163]